MKLTVLYFAVVRERLGKEREVIEIEGEITASDLWQHLVAKHRALQEFVQVVRLAVNQEFAADQRRLQDGDEIAIIPPVSGGQGGLAQVRDRPLLLDEVVDAVTRTSQGAVVTFIGNVRAQSQGKNIVALDYEAYVPMAERRLREIVAKIENQILGARVAILHRIGALRPGDTAVVIAASAPHRDEAFAACRDAIEELKASVPIWKRETAEDGATWVGFGP